ncbi:structural constituent of cuticle [Lecanora helva]
MSQERNRAFCGSIKYPLHRLRFEDKNPRQLDASNVERLVRVFELEGCRRLDNSNHVPAVVSRDSLVTICASVPGGETRLKSHDEEPPLLDTPTQLIYLHGRHRLETAKRTLSANEKWWVIDLFAEDRLSLEEINAIRNEYLNARNWYDGDVFRQIRRCHRVGDGQGKMQWLSRLSAAKQRDMQILEKRRGIHDQAFAKSLDDLLDFPGLWPALQLGTFHRLLSLRCAEEMTRYLHCVWRTWNHVTQGDISICSHLDASTVEILEGRCPAVPTDRRYIEAQQSLLFTTVTDPHKRETLMARISSIEYLIPSIHTFLEDTKYLEPCAKIMKRLLPPKSKKTIHQAFEILHNGQRSIKVQLTETSSRDEEQSSAAIGHWKAYRMLWLFALRHFPQMTGHAPRKDATTPKFPRRSIELIWWHGIVELAIACGYQDIEKPCSSLSEADIGMAEDFLRRARPLALDFSGPEFESKVEAIVSVLQGMNGQGHSDQSFAPRLACPTDIAHRCGIPFEESYFVDRDRLFLTEIYHPREVEDPLSTFAVKRDMFWNFFGTLDGQTADTFSRRPDMRYSVSEYSQISNLSPPFSSNVAPHSTSSASSSEVSTPRPYQSNNTMLGRPMEGITQIQNSGTSEIDQSVSHRSVPYSEAQHIFWSFQREPRPDPNQIVILKEQNNGMFSIHVMTFEDRTKLVAVLRNHRAYVRDGPSFERQKLTNLFDIWNRREPCVMVYHPRHEEQIQRHFEEISTR